ncbi:conserved Plasmodium protein, unknown function [Plasmodium gallinaceum]|uniref:Uncharacterized protein n=1 Tax=Plasmodium gallinaceum TaxID=5849 RepID=A0A1J1H3B2_PLAGA|nr:conserved Plasmodium protein, unknown function [Plasmodium gallinaceum]CRG97831.1 conserved Plasmodium protein, unknown function [Plasmodium gallinaceum]
MKYFFFHILFYYIYIKYFYKIVNELSLRKKRNLIAINAKDRHSLNLSRGGNFIRPFLNKKNNSNSKKKFVKKLLFKNILQNENIFLNKDVFLKKRDNYISKIGILLNKECHFTKKKKNKCSRLLAKLPVITINKKLYPKEHSTDYENVLRKYHVTYINYKTRLRSKKEIDIRSIDDLYGKIYDRNVLKKQFYFFLYHDDINTCYNILNENRNVLTREESFKILNSLPYIFFNHLNYIYPTENNVDEVLSKLLKTYIFQYGNDKNIDFLNFKYKYNELDEYCQQLERDFMNEQSQLEKKRPNENLSKEVLESNKSDTVSVFTTNNDNSLEEKKETLNYEDIYDDENNTNYEEKYKHMNYDYKIIEATQKYKELIHKFKNYPPNIKLEKVQLLYTKILSMKGNKIFEAFRKHESIKKNKERKIYRNARLKLDVNKLTPYLNEPIKYDKKKKEEVNKLFEKYVEEKDLKNSCLIIRKYTNLIDTKKLKSREIMKKFLKLHEYIYKCNKYNEKELSLLRMIYYSTVQKPRVIRKICEVGMLDQGENITHKEVYEEELNRYLKQRNELFDERMKKKNINMDEIRDFSSAYPMEWLPVIHKDLFEEVEKERSLKNTDKHIVKKKKESIKKLFTSITEQNIDNSLNPLEMEKKDKDKPYDELNGKNELKIGRNIINYKKIIKGKNKKKKDKTNKPDTKTT